MASSAGAPSTTGVAVPAGNREHGAVATVCRPGCQVVVLVADLDAVDRPVARTVHRLGTCSATSVWIQTVVCSASVGGAGRLNVRWSPKKQTSANTAGIDQRGELEPELERLHERDRAHAADQHGADDDDQPRATEPSV